MRTAPASRFGAAPAAAPARPAAAPPDAPDPPDPPRRPTTRRAQRPAPCANGFPAERANRAPNHSFRGTPAPGNSGALRRVVRSRTEPLSQHPCEAGLGEAAGARGGGRGGAGAGEGRPGAGPPGGGAASSGRRPDPRSRPGRAARGPRGPQRRGPRTRRPAACTRGPGPTGGAPSAHCTPPCIRLHWLVAPRPAAQPGPPVRPDRWPRPGSRRGGIGSERRAP